MSDFSQIYIFMSSFFIPGLYSLISRISLVHIWKTDHVKAIAYSQNACKSFNIILRIIRPNCPETRKKDKTGEKKHDLIW